MAIDETNQITTPEGRLTFEHLFERSVYTDPKGREGKPQYQATLMLDPSDPEYDAFVTDVFNFACDAFGDDVNLDIDGGTIRTPFKKGDEYVTEQAAKGKERTAAAGLIMVKASTEFNANGDTAVGGIRVYGPDVKRIEPVQRELVYNGSYGRMGIKLSAYDVDRQKGIKFYLVAYQKTRDGERLATSDSSKMFKPVGRAAEGTTPSNVAPIRQRTRG